MSEKIENSFENQELEALVNESEQADFDTSETVEETLELTDADHELATQALAGSMVKGLEKLVQMRYPVFKLDEEGKNQGVEAFAPIASDFAGDMPDWLKPYAKYLSAGMFITGVIFEANRQEKIELQKQEVKKSGDKPEYSMEQSA